VAGRRRANREGTIYYDEARGVYVAQRYVETLDGRPKRITGRGRTQELAWGALRARERSVGASSLRADVLTVSAYLEHWLAHKEANAKARTAREYRQVLEHHVLPELGEYRLSKVRPAHVQRVIDAVVRAGKRTTAHNARRYLSQAFAQAVRWELLARNPVVGVAPVEVPDPKRGLWTIEQTTVFLESARAGTRYHPLFLVAIVTGLRQGELVALPWSNVTSEGVRVDRTWSRDGVEGYDTPKTRHAYRDVPISRDVFEAMARTTDGKLAFPSAAGTMVSPWNVQRAFRESVARAGVQRIRFHDLRRIAATLWARQGVEPRVIQHLLGHATPHLALRVYQGVLEERVVSARLDARMLFGCNATSHEGQTEGDGDARIASGSRFVN
jgi:integrase